EALRDPLDRAAVLAAVEDVGGLDDRDLVVGESAQDRLRDDRLLGARAAAAEQAAEPAAPPALAGDGRRRRAALLQPAVLERDVDAERADVDEVGAAVRREPR